MSRWGQPYLELAVDTCVLISSVIIAIRGSTCPGTGGRLLPQDQVSFIADDSGAYPRLRFSREWEWSLQGLQTQLADGTGVQRRTWGKHIPVCPLLMSFQRLCVCTHMYLHVHVC